MNHEPILYSLAHFREIFLAAFDLAGVKRFVEVGSEYGSSTEQLLDYARRVGGQLITIDPAPQDAARALIAANSGQPHFQFIEGTSLEVLPTLAGVDAYIVDGDHNYYTVHNELEEIAKMYGGRPWLIFAHDVGWPCGRRDMYYAPERIPAEARHPYLYNVGVRPDAPEPFPGGFGDIPGLAIAIAEGGPRNGVRTAIEDFLAGRPDLRLDVIPAIFGVGVIYSRNAPWSQQLSELLHPFANSPLLERMEKNRVWLSVQLLHHYRLMEAHKSTPDQTGLVPEALPGRLKLEMFRVPNRAAFDALWSSRLDRMLREQDSLFRPAGNGTETFKLGGLCVVCGGDKDFTTDFMFASPDAHGRILPAWRERQICTCALNCRQRSSYHILTQVFGLNANSVVYCTEQTTELFRRIRQAFPRAVGSEYLGNSVPLGMLNGAGIRNEDITRLTFPDASFDCLFTLDVMEHVPDYRAGFREMARCLKPGGHLLMTAPFHFTLDKTVVRASVNPDGTLTHHLPPVYHGDPIDPKGVLCFNDYGWDMMDDLRAAGFPDATMFIYSAPHYGYIGFQYVILATRQPIPANGASRGFSWNPIAIVAKKPARQEPLLPDAPVELHRQAAAFCQEGKWDAAEPYFRKLTKIKPDKFEGWKGRVDCARSQNQSVMADLILEEALERHPQWAKALNKTPPAAANCDLSHVEGRTLEIP